MPKNKVVKRLHKGLDTDFDTLARVVVRRAGNPGAHSHDEYLRRDGTTTLTGSWNAGTPVVLINRLGLGAASPWLQDRWLHISGWNDSASQRGILIESLAGRNSQVGRGIDVRIGASPGDGSPMTIDRLEGIRLKSPSLLNATATCSYGLIIEDPRGNQYNYGIYIGDVVQGLYNYSIYTETGSVLFGDNTCIAGNITASGNIHLGAEETAGGSGVMHLSDATASPSGVPSDGGILWSQNGSPMWKNEYGEVFNLAGSWSGSNLDDVYLRRDGTTTLTGSWNAGEGQKARFWALLVGGKDPFPALGLLGTERQVYVATTLYASGSIAGGEIIGVAGGSGTGSAIGLIVQGGASPGEGWNDFTQSRVISLYVRDAKKAPGTSINRFYGVYIEDPSQSAASSWALYAAGGLAYFGGDLAAANDTLNAFAGSPGNVAIGAAINPGGSGVVYMHNANASPPSAGASGALFWSASGLPYWMDSSGNVYNLAASGASAAAPVSACYVLTASHGELSDATVIPALAGSDAQDGYVLTWVDSASNWQAAQVTGSCICATKRSLGWYLSGSVTAGSNQLQIYRLDAPTRLLGVDLNAKAAPSGCAAVIDMLYSTDYASWTSLFSTKPRIPDGSNIGGGSAVFSTSTLSSGTWIMLSVDSACGAEDVMAQLRVLHPSGSPKMLGWYLAGSATTGSAMGAIYRLDEDLLMNDVQLNAKVPPGGGSMQIDIKYSADYSTWSSLFSTQPGIPSGCNLGGSPVFSTASLSQGVWLRLDVTESNGEEDVTVQLLMEKL